MATLKNLSMAPLGAVLIASVTVDVVQATTFYGNIQPLGDGLIRSFVTLDDSEQPLEIGAKFRQQALSNLPSERPAYIYELSLPQEASTTAIKGLAMAWVTQGHMPEEIFGIPHFHFEFTLLSQQERQQITGTGDDEDRAYKLPPPEFTPQDYRPLDRTSFQPGLGLLMVDTTAPFFQGEALTAAPFYHSYNGQIVNDELMIAKSFLETKPNISGVLKLPAAYPKSAYYPTEYRVSYDATTQEYTVSLSELTYRSAKPIPELSPIWGLLAIGAWGAVSQVKNKLQKKIS